MLKKLSPDSRNAYYAGFNPPDPDTSGQTALPGPINHPPVFLRKQEGGPQFCVFSPSTLLRLAVSLSNLAVSLSSLFGFSISNFDG
jgi:hypothetical protein